MICPAPMKFSVTILSVDRHIELGRIVVRDPGVVRRVHVLEEQVLHLLGGGNSALRVIRQIVSNLRALQPQAISEVVRKRDANWSASGVCSTRKPTRNCRVMLSLSALVSAGPKMRRYRCRRVEVRAIDAIDEINGRDVRIGARNSPP